MRHLRNHAPHPQYLALADFPDGSNGPARHADSVELGEPFVSWALLDDRLQQRDEDVAVANPAGRVCKSRVVCQLRRAGRRAEAVPEIVIGDAEVDPTVSGL